MIKKLILWILVLACMGTIFWFSAQVADDSEKASEGFTYTVVKFFDFGNKVSDERAKEIADELDGIVRKVAHFGIYAVLGFLIALLLNEYRRVYLHIVIYSVVSSFLYSCTDELHQYFVPGRSAQMGDIVIDTCGSLCGAVFAVMIVSLIKWYKKRHSVQK